MQRKDYQDALNELRLSSKFCEEMEKKLSEAASESDEYIDEVTHVDVVPQRSFKKTAIAAAVTLAICGIGGGTLYTYKDDVKEAFGNTESDTGAYETYTYNFPFGSIDLRGSIFNYYPYYSVASGGATIVTDIEKAKKLSELFADVTFEKVDVNEEGYGDLSYHVGDMISTHDSKSERYIDFYEDGYIRIQKYADGVQYSVVSPDDVSGNVDITVDSFVFDDGTADYSEPTYLYDEYYKMPIETFRSMRSIIFGSDTSGSVNVFGYSTEFSGAEFKTPFSEGTISAVQAHYITDIIRAATWEKPMQDHSSEECDVITITSDHSDSRYNIRFCSNGIAYITFLNEDGSVIKDSTYRYGKQYYNDILEILDDGKKCYCPLKYEPSEKAGIMINTYSRSSDNNSYSSNSYFVSGEKYKELMDKLESMNWIQAVSSYPDHSTFDGIYIDTGTKFLSIDSNGKCELYNTASGTHLTSNTYFVESDDYLELVNWAKELESHPDDGNDLAHLAVEKIFGSLNDKGIGISYSSSMTSNINDMVDIYTTDLVDELYETLSEIEWEAAEPQDLLSEAMYYITGSNGSSFITLTRSGIMADMLTERFYKCSEPEKYNEIIDEMFRLKNNPTVQKKYEALLPDND